MVEKTTKYKIFIVIVFLYFIAEIAVGIHANSIALQTDAFHMLSDLIALIIAYKATLLTKKDKSQEYTYGWLRAEIIGGLINSIFLLAICFSLLLDVGERIADLILNGAQNQKLLKEIDLLLIIAGGGLFLNLIGLALFHHEHNHGHQKNTTHDHGENEEENAALRTRGNGNVCSGDLGSTTAVETDIESGFQSDIETEAESMLAAELTLAEGEINSADYNQQAVLLHILGDTLGSVVVVASGLAIKYIDSDWKYYLDPLASLLIISLISYSSGILAKKCVRILLHRSPQEINYQELLGKIKQIREVNDIHHFHIWPLTSQICKASVHIRLKLSLDQTHYLEITDRVISEIKKIFHQYGIHSSTIQPEWKTGCLEPNCQDGCGQLQCCSVTK